jgi:hypothetical protein
MLAAFTTHLLTHLYEVKPKLPLVSKQNATKEYTRRGDKALHILVLGTRWWWLSVLHSSRLFPAKGPPVPVE